MLRFSPALALALFLGPVVAGVLCTLAPAFDVLPALGRSTPSLRPWSELIAEPGFAAALRLTIVTGTLSSALAFALAVLIAGALYDRRAARQGEALLSFLLATPHAAIAVGLAFLVAPSGWIARLLAPFAGWTQPPDAMLVNDPYGGALIAGLIVKEVPYLLMMMLAALNQTAWRDQARLARALGYRPFAIWLKVILPQIYPQLRLPLFAMIAYSFSTVDMAIILGPSTPPTLAVLAVRRFLDHDLEQYFAACAAACLLAAIVLLAVAAWILAERAVRSPGRAWVARGRRSGAHAAARPLGQAAAALVVVCGFGAILVLMLASITGAWRFPAILPTRWTLSHWQRQLAELGGELFTTIVTALAATLIALALAIACLENERRRGRAAGARTQWLLYAPLLVPQVAFLLGLQILLVALNIDGTWLALVWTHLVFVFPYLFLSLAEPWRAFDPRYARAAAALGASRHAILRRVVLPMLLRPVLIAAAVGFAVSVALYLPTLFAGAGRFATLTTEAVTLASGADRMVVAVVAFMQAALPLLVYAAALGAPMVIWRNRRALRP
jgi:putative thiamine transport system permease protein